MIFRPFLHSSFKHRSTYFNIETNDWSYTIQMMITIILKKVLEKDSKHKLLFIIKNHKIFEIIKTADVSNPWKYMSHVQQHTHAQRTHPNSTHKYKSIQHVNQSVEVTLTEWSKPHENTSLISDKITDKKAKLKMMCVQKFSVELTTNLSPCEYAKMNYYYLVRLGCHFIALHLLGAPLE